MTKGTYALVLWLAESRRLQIGKLGVHCFPAGHYVYVGSALGGLEQRVNRHLRQGKVQRWHIDHLREAAHVVEVWSAVGDQRLECRWMQAVAKLKAAQLIVPRFGSSDCRCRAHLAYFTYKPDLSLLAEARKGLGKENTSREELDGQIGSTGRL